MHQLSVEPPDRILDFTSGTDQINLHQLGINASNVSITASGTDTLISVDINNDGAADFHITLVNTPAPAMSDFLF